MKMILAVLAAISAALLMLPANGNAQTPPKAPIFTIAGHPGEAQLLQVDGKSYVEIESLALLTQGTLSFKTNRTILTLPPSNAETPESAPPVKQGFSTAFIQAGIEEMSLIREWRIAIVNAVESNSPVSVEWVAGRQRLADKNLALASAAVSTDDDRSAYPLLTAEFNSMQKLSEAYLAMRQRAAFISPDTFNNSPLEEQVLSCARGFVAMAESHEFQDQSSCH
jgi:hypothetical protein